MPLEALLRTGSQGGWDTNDAYASGDVLTGKLLSAFPQGSIEGRKNKNRPDRLPNRGPTWVDRARFKMKRGTE